MTESTETVTPDEIFRLVGNDQRMRIMEILWEEFEFADYVTGIHQSVPFSDLFERAGAEDSGNFNYHVNQLTGNLIERDDGYRLSPLGYNLMRAIERYSSFTYFTIKGSQLDDPCPFCGGTLQGAYERELVGITCRDCDALNDGNFTYVQIPGTYAGDFEIESMLDLGSLLIEERVAYTKHGVCPDCYAPLDRQLTKCGGHATDGTENCPICDQRFGLEIRAHCEVCGWGGAGPFVEFAVIDPLARGFMTEAGCGPDQVGPWQYRLALFEAISEIDTNPRAPCYELVMEDDRFELTFDDLDLPSS